MNISDIHELYFITDISNVASIMREGILSHNEALRVHHHSIAEQGVQERRQNKKIPGTNKHVHDYANLYFDAHNPMLSARRGLNNTICVLRINSDILSIDGVIVTDQNASRDCWFKPVNEGLPLLKHSEVFEVNWIRRNDPMEEYRLKGIKCAEVLVPKCVDCRYVFGAYVSNSVALSKFKQASSLPVEIKENLFF
ncbi:MAG: DUF4433 domain-containing protein [Candidatus Omnitrophica bacterium]|nr:DUF4433 domain-containing protein [Candidatus Omnitrophota bacterium]MBU4479347.1 DUF4433 domain-containing protein [Candidatus Omnitrophota bacterium]MCG2704442.1 DUF4433 domain-containing protein [Candidatus Omnitrophota bacterium]